MKILALDAALGPFSTALVLPDRTWADRSNANDALEAGLSRIDALLKSADIRLGALDRIAVGVGPGSFTGLRIALSFAKSLAYAAKLPLTGISSYDAITPDGAPLPLLALVRGRTGVICARLTATDGSQRIACGPTASVLDELLTGRIASEDLALAGDTSEVLAELRARRRTVTVVAARAESPALAIADLARSHPASPSPHALAPDYGEVPAVTAPKVRA